MGGSAASGEIMNPCLATHLKVEPALQAPLVIVTRHDLNKIDRGGTQAWKP
jgi:hypothetical protein